MESTAANWCLPLKLAEAHATIEPCVAWASAHTVRATSAAIHSIATGCEFGSDTNPSAPQIERSVYGKVTLTF